MRIGFVELVLLLFIASITVGPNVALFVDRCSAAPSVRLPPLPAGKPSWKHRPPSSGKPDDPLPGGQQHLCPADAGGAGVRPAAAALDTPPKVYTAPDVRQDTGAAQTALSADSKDSWKLGGYLGVDCVRTRTALSTLLPTTVRP